MALWAVGALINILGSIMINLGTNIIKLGHTRKAVHRSDLEEEMKANAPRLLRQPGNWYRYPGNKVWLGGMLMFTVGNLLNFASFAFAAQSLLSALGVVQFISNIIFGRFVNKEQVTKRVLFATAVVCTGCVLLVAFGNHESPTLSTHDMLELYSKPLYITYLCLIFTISPVFYALYRAGKRQIVADASGAAAARWARWLPICYALFAGPLGTQSVLYGKTISMLLRTTFGGDSQLDSWYTWVSLLLFILFAGFWMSRYSKGMKLFPVLIIMPVIQIVWILFSMVSGSIYFQEYKTLTALSGTMFGVGVVVELVGVWILTGGQQPGMAAQPSQPELKKSELSEEERERTEELDEAALRSKAPLSDNLEVVAPQALLEPEEALVARKLSTVYERRSMGAASSGGSGGGPRLLAPRPGSGRRGPGGGAPSLGRRSVEAAGSVSEQLMEEGVVDSAALEDTATAPGASRGHLPGVGEAEEDVEAAAAEAAAACQPAPAAAAAAAGAGEGGETAQTSLMHDIVHDWGVGMRDLNAVMRASVGVYQDEDETTAFSIWSMPIATSFTSGGGRRHSIDAPGLRGGATFRVRAAYDAQLAGRTPSPISGGSGGGLPPLGVTLDDGVLGSTRGRGRRPGHRRLNRSRSANELEDMLREAALEEQLGMELAERQAGSQAGSQAGGPEPSAESPWQVASSTATGGSVAAGGVNGGTPLSLRHGSAPVLSAVLLGGGGSTPAGANGSVSRAPMLSSPGSLPRRPFSTEPPRGLPPISPAFSAGSQQDESGSPPAPVPARDGGIPISDFLPSADSVSMSPAASWKESVRKGDKAS